MPRFKFSKKNQNFSLKPTHERLLVLRGDDCVGQQVEGASNPAQGVPPRGTQQRPKHSSNIAKSPWREHADNAC